MTLRLVDILHITAVIHLIKILLLIMDGVLILHQILQALLTISQLIIKLVG